MRLGRSIAALGGALALVAAGTALASPAAADESDFQLNDVDVIRTAPDKAVTVTGTGCAPVNGKPSVVLWALYIGIEDPVAEGVVPANEDGTWSVDLDIPGIVKDNNLSDPSTGMASFYCENYNGEGIGMAQPSLQIDSTDVDGKAAIVSSDTDGDGNYDHQHFDIDLIGFTPGETVTFYLDNAETGHYVRDLFEVPVGGDGRVVYTGDVPTDLPDGKYRIVIQGSNYGEGLVSKPIEVAHGWWNVQNEDIPVDPDNPNPNPDNPNPNPDNPNPAVDPNPTPTADPTTDPAPAAPTTAAAKPANGKSGLANTGAGLGVVVVAGGLLAAGGILVARRRRAA